METKLVLTIESDLAKTVKSYAKTRGYTLSGLVGSYFSSLIMDEETKDITSTTSLANQLWGSLKAPVEADYKKELTNVLVEKYL